MTDEEERKAAEAIKLDGCQYQFLTEEILDEFLPIIFGIGQLEDDFISQFEKKAGDKGIAVNKNYVNRLWKDHKPVPGVDLRSGEYGIEYAGMGFFHAGRQYYDTGDMENALKNLEKAIELCPRNILARSLKMQIHQDNRNLWLTAAEAGNSILLNPVSIAEKDSASREVLEKYSGDLYEEFEYLLVHAYYYRGWALYELKDYEGAVADYSESIRRDPSLLVAVDGRLGAYMHTNRWDEALADCDTLVAGGYEPANAHQYRGVVLKMMERYWEAIEEFNTAIAIKPELTAAYLQRSICNFSEDFFEAAANDASEAIKRNVPYAHYYRAKAYFYSGEYTKAIEDFDIAEREDPEDDSIKTFREHAKEYKDKGIITGYHRQNEKGEWEHVENRDGDIVQIIPTPNYQEYLDEYRKEEAEERLLAAKKE